MSPKGTTLAVPSCYHHAILIRSHVAGRTGNLYSELPSARRWWRTRKSWHDVLIWFYRCCQNWESVSLYRARAAPFGCYQKDCCSSGQVHQLVRREIRTDTLKQFRDRFQLAIGHFSSSIKVWIKLNASQTSPPWRITSPVPLCAHSLDIFNFAITQDPSVSPWVLTDLCGKEKWNPRSRIKTDEYVVKGTSTAKLNRSTKPQELPGLGDGALRSWYPKTTLTA